MTDAPTTRQKDATKLDDESVAELPPTPVSVATIATMLHQVAEEVGEGTSDNGRNEDANGTTTVPNPSFEQAPRSEGNVTVPFNGVKEIFERPSTHRKYRKVFEGPSASETEPNKAIEILSSPLITATQVIEEVIDTVRGDNHSNQNENGVGLKDLIDNTVSGILERPPARKKYKKVADTAAKPPFASPLAGIKKAMSKGTKMVSDSIDKAKSKAKPLPTNDPPPQLLPAPEENDGGQKDSEQPTLLPDGDEPTPERAAPFAQLPSHPNATTTLKSPFVGVKKFVTKTTQVVTDNIDKAKHRALELSGETPPKNDLSGATMIDAVTPNAKKEDGECLNDDASSSVASVLNESLLKKPFRKTRNILKKVIGGRKSKTRGEMKDQDRNLSVASETPLQEDLEDDTDFKIVLTPLMRYLLHDVTIASFILLLIASIPTFRNWSSIMNKQLPASVMGVWLLVSFCAGMEIGRCRGMRNLEVTTKHKQEEKSHSFQVTPASTLTNVSELPIPSVIDSVRNEQRLPVKEGYALIYTLLKPIVSIEFVDPADISNAQATATEAKNTAISTASGKAWSTLTHETREAWEQVGFVQVADPLMNRLLRNPDYPRKLLREIVALEKSEDPASSVGCMGTFDSTKCAAETLENDVINPCCKLRGLDVFLTDAPETGMALHPFLVHQGLRDKPTIVANIMVQWANILIYFELPEWFTDFENLEEKDTDLNDVRAMKRFLSGDDAYRNQRLKILPCVVEGPMPIRIMAPPKKEITLPVELIPSTWVFHNKETAPDGRVLQPCVEVELDIVSNSSLRSISSMLRRYIKSISLDLALIIEKPTLKDPDEPTACAGLWRFHHINLDDCPPLPDRCLACDGETKVQRDIRRVSQIVNMTSSEQVQIEKEMLLKCELDGNTECAY